MKLVARSLPILGNVERPVELEMSAVIVVCESDTCLVMTTSEHAGRSLFFGESLLVLRLVGGVRCEAADHFLVLADADTLALDRLDVLQAGEDFVVDSEDDFHLVGATFLDREGVFAESLNRAGFGQINHDRGPTLDFLASESVIGTDPEPRKAYQSKRFDDAGARVFGVTNWCAAAESKGFLVSLHRLIVRI